MSVTANTEVIWVSPFVDAWEVSRGDGDQAEVSFDGREDALSWAFEAARGRAPCLVRLTDAAGRIRAQFAFDAD
jgi:hypothetical protein